jgi:hypothetical protein
VEAEVKERDEAGRLLKVPGAKETPDQLKQRLWKTQMRLRRVVIHCNDDIKKDWEGETLKIGNNIIGSFTKFVPFDLDEGYYLPQAMLDHLEEARCQKFRNVKRPDGEMQKVPYLTKAYNITYLPDLTKTELKDLADDQRVRGAIDNDDLAYD